MTQAVTAQLRYYRMGPKKLRLIVDLIRGKRVTRAQSVLSLLNKKGAKPMLKLLNSAVANAKHNHNLGLENLIVKSIMVDGGPVLKRFMPKAHGRATPVRERTSHVSLVLEALEKKSEARNKKSETNSNIKNTKT
ncbi:MAG: 50S ribosomal protein L22 [Patescibacteria group bacterium]